MERKRQAWGTGLALGVSFGFVLGLPVGATTEPFLKGFLIALGIGVVLGLGLEIYRMRLAQKHLKGGRRHGGGRP
jgi:hypothetical protein